MTGARLAHPERPEFERCWPWLKEAVAHYGDTYRKKHVWKAIEDGDALLWSCETAAIVTEVKVWPTGMKEVFLWLGGGDLNGIQTLVPYIEIWAKKRGCARSVIPMGRSGWSRVLDGYHSPGASHMKDL